MVWSFIGVDWVLPHKGKEVLAEWMVGSQTQGYESYSFFHLLEHLEGHKSKIFWENASFPQIVIEMIYFVDSLAC